MSFAARHLKTIVISGAKSGVGKTAFAQQILYGLSGWSALKVTVIRQDFCPKVDGCKVCPEFTKDWQIITDKHIINEPGTDTARLKQSGAKDVVWLKTKLSKLKNSLTLALRRLKDSKGVVIEGTSVLKCFNPDLAIYLDDKSNRLRAAAKNARKKADIIIDASR